jgi:LAS superfamily LD-carboxypeptidase LdcB
MGITLIGLGKTPKHIVFVALLFLGFNYTQGALACIEPEAVYPDLSLLSISPDTGLPLGYIPTNLVDLGGSVETDGSVCLRREAAEDLITMFRAAEKDGVHLAVTAAYMNAARQEYIYQYWLKTEELGARYGVVKPGFSEHQLGTAVDLTDSSIKYLSVNPDFNTDKGGRWMKKNAHKYGFVMSYPEDKIGKASFHYEPWHWRYIGSNLADRTLNWETDFTKLNEGRIMPTMVSVRELNPLILSADAFISVYLEEDKKFVLIAKNEDKQLPIASISKLVAAMAIKEYYKENAEIIIGNDQLSGGGSSNRYRTGDAFKATDLLYSALIESDNDAVMAFANALSEEALINMMNSIAKQSGMNNTVFYTPTGLDSWDGGPKYNLSTPNNVVTIIGTILEKHPEILDITHIREFVLYDIGGNKHHVVINTNELLNDTNLGVEIIGGKTGTTPKARENLVLVTKPPQGGGVIVNVILGSDDHFGDMRALIGWILKNYRWVQSSGFNVGMGIIN